MHSKDESKEVAGVKAGKPDLRLVDTDAEAARAAEALLEAEEEEWRLDREERFGISGVDLSSLMFSVDNEGVPKAIKMVRANAAAILNQAAATRHMLGYDVFKQNMILWHEVPEVIWDADHQCRVKTDPPILDKPIKFTDKHTGQIQLWLQQEGRLSNCSDMLAFQAAETVAHANGFHPVKDYLSGLVWDGVPRVRTVFADMFGVDDTEYSRRVAEIFFVSAVMRIFRPGCKADYMMILEGPQGYLKSTFFSILAGEWFSNSLPVNVESKDAMQHLLGKWIIEVAELVSLRKAESDAMKHFISKERDQYRPSYGRLDVDVVRQCVFAGTTNESGYLKDDTGNRRYLPLLIKKRLDREKLVEIRDQLWAEAVQMWKDGVTNWPDAEFEDKWMKPEQAERMMEDPWQEKIETYLKGMGKAGKQRTYLAIAKNAFDIQEKDVNGLVRTRIKSVMMRLGYVSVKIAGERRWELPGAETS